MITVFSGTNRKGSRTRLFADFVYEYMKSQADEEVTFFSLEDLPDDMLSADMYSSDHQSEALAKIQDKYLVPAQKFYFVIPEYNGGIPGVLKFFIDACSIRKYKESFHGGKKAALLGIAAGRSGNLRGMEYMTGFLSYLDINVMPNRQPISSIEKLIKANQLTDKVTQDVIYKHIDSFLKF